MGERSIIGERAIISDFCMFGYIREDTGCLICCDGIDRSSWPRNCLYLQCHYPICVYCLCRLRRPECPYCTQSLSTVGPLVVRCIVYIWSMVGLVYGMLRVIYEFIHEYAMILHPELYTNDTFAAF
jgi:hypothetical protein